MGKKELLLESAQEYDAYGATKKQVDLALVRLSEFLQLYPFRKEPGRIDQLTALDLYDPGKKYFFDWIEHKLKALAHLKIGSDLIWRNARENIETFKHLLRMAVSESMPLSEKIDANWEDIKFFGGDKNVAKKIIWCYFPDDFLPILKTEDLEHFVYLFEVDYRKEAQSIYHKEYAALSVGEKYQLLNAIACSFKNGHSQFNDWNNLYFNSFLYKTNSPRDIEEEEVEDMQQQRRIRKAKLAPASDLPRKAKWIKTTAGIKMKVEPGIAKLRLERADYTCENDPTHKSFLSATMRKPYVEAHHLVPLKAQKDFGDDNCLDHQNNIFALCANCHRLLHHAVGDEKRPLLQKLYDTRRNKREKAGIKLTFDQLFEYYR